MKKRILRVELVAGLLLAATTITALVTCGLSLWCALQQHWLLTLLFLACSIYNVMSAQMMEWLTQAACELASEHNSDNIINRLTNRILEL